MRQSLSLSRPATVKLLHVTLRTLHNWETGKVRIPYAAFKLVRLFSSYEIFHPIWKDWRIIGSRLITPEGHSLEAANFHWLSLMARRAEAFSTLSRQHAALRAQVQRQNQVNAGLGQNPVPPHGFAPPLPALFGSNPADLGDGSTGLVYYSTSENKNRGNQQNQALQGKASGHFEHLSPIVNPGYALNPVPRASTVGGAL